MRGKKEVENMKGWMGLILGVIIGLIIVVGIKFLDEQKVYAQSSQTQVYPLQIVDTKEGAFLIDYREKEGVYKYNSAMGMFSKIKVK